jgi:ligand-binding sensor domain-containing protein
MRLSAGTLLLLCAVHPLSAQSSRDWRPSERTIIGDFSRITAIAGALDRVYVASPGSLLIWHPQFRRWDGPFTPPDPAMLANVFAGLVDPLDQSLWLARPDGWVHYQPELDLWDQGRVGEAVGAIALDQDDPLSGLYLRTRRGWFLLPRGGMVPAPSRPPARPLTPVTVEDVLRASPTLQANAAQILLDDRLGTVRYTAAARAFDNSGWYLGTSGAGLLFLQDGAAIPERLPFGLPSLRVGAVMTWPGGVWVATDRTTQADAAVTFVGEGLSEFNTLRGPPATGAPFTRVLELAGQGKAVYAATDYGLARVDPADGRIQMVDERLGLPDSRVYSVASRLDQVTVGTARGIARVDGDLQVELPAPEFAEAAYAVYPSADSIWVATPRGLLLALPGERNLVRPATLRLASLQVPVVALASLGDTVVALTRDQLLWRDPAGGKWTLGPSLSGLLGRLRAFAADGPGFWVAGERGVGFARLDGAPLRVLREGDLPGVVTDIAADREHLWVGTDRGLARFRLDAIRP